MCRTFRKPGRLACRAQKRTSPPSTRDIACSCTQRVRCLTVTTTGILSCNLCKACATLTQSHQPCSLSPTLCSHDQINPHRIARRTDAVARRTAALDEASALHAEVAEVGEGPAALEDAQADAKKETLEFLSTRYFLEGSRSTSDRSTSRSMKSSNPAAKATPLLSLLWWSRRPSAWSSRSRRRIGGRSR